MNFEIIIASPPDREKLTAEIWFNHKMVAEINQETQILGIDLYSHNDLTIPVDEFCDILQEAKLKLSGNSAVGKRHSQNPTEE